MTYKYKCNNCENIYEIEQKITDPAISTCPKCNCQDTKRQLYAAAFHLGPGAWAKQGYSSK